MDPDEAAANELQSVVDELDRTGGWTPERTDMVRRAAQALVDKRKARTMPPQTRMVRPTQYGPEHLAEANALYSDAFKPMDTVRGQGRSFSARELAGSDYRPAGGTSPNSQAARTRKAQLRIESLTGEQNPGTGGLAAALADERARGLADATSPTGAGTNALQTLHAAGLSTEAAMTRGMGNVINLLHLGTPEYRGALAGQQTEMEKDIGRAYYGLPTETSMDKVLNPFPAENDLNGIPDAATQMARGAGIVLPAMTALTPLDPANAAMDLGIAAGGSTLRGIRAIPQVVTKIRESRALGAIQEGMKAGGAAKIGEALDAMDETRKFMDEAARLQFVDAQMGGAMADRAAGVREAASKAPFMDPIMKAGGEYQLPPDWMQDPFGEAVTAAKGRNVAATAAREEAIRASRGVNIPEPSGPPLLGGTNGAPVEGVNLPFVGNEGQQVSRAWDATGVTDEARMNLLVDDLSNRGGVLANPGGPVRLPTVGPIGGAFREMVRTGTVGAPGVGGKATIDALEALGPAGQEAILEEAAGVMSRGEGISQEAAKARLRAEPDKLEQYVLPIVEAKIQRGDLPYSKPALEGNVVNTELGTPPRQYPPAYRQEPLVQEGPVLGESGRGPLPPMARPSGGTTLGSGLGGIQGVRGAAKVALGAGLGGVAGAVTAPDEESRPGRVLAGALLGGTTMGIGTSPRIMRAVGDLWAKGGEMARPLTGPAAEATAALRAKAEKAAIAMTAPAEWVGEKGQKAYTALFDAMGAAKKRLTQDERFFGQSFGYLFTSGDLKPRYREGAQRVTEIIKGTPELFDYDVAPALDVVARAQKAHPDIPQEVWDAGYAYIDGTMKVDQAAFSKLPEDVQKAFKDYASQRLAGTKVLVENGNIPPEAAEKYARSWASQSDLAKVQYDDDILRKAFGAEVPGANVKARSMNPATPEQARAIGIETDPHYAMTLGNYKQSRAVMMSKSVEALRQQSLEIVGKAKTLGVATEDGKAMLRTSPLLPPETFGKTDNLVELTSARARAEAAGYVYMAPTESAFKPFGKAEGWWMAKELRDHMRGMLEFSDNAAVNTLRRLTGISNLANIARVSAFLRDGTTNTLKAVMAGVSPFNPGNAAHYADAVSVLARSGESISGLGKTGEQAFRSLVDTQGAGAFWVKQLAEELDAPIRAAMRAGKNPHEAMIDTIVSRLTSLDAKSSPRHIANEVVKYKVWIDNYFKVAHALKLARESQPSMLRRAAERAAVGAGAGALLNKDDRLKGAAYGAGAGLASMAVLPGRKAGAMTLEAAAREARRYYPAPGFELGLFEQGRKLPGAGLGLTYWSGTFRGIKNIALDRPEGFAYAAATLGGLSALGDAWGKVTPEERAKANEAHGKFSTYLYRDQAGQPHFFDPMGMDVWTPFASAAGLRGKVEHLREGVVEAASDAATQIALAPIVQGTLDAGRVIQNKDAQQMFRKTPIRRPGEYAGTAALRTLGTGTLGAVPYTIDTATRTIMGRISPKKAIFSYIGLSPQATPDQRLRSLISFPKGLVMDFRKEKSAILKEVQSGERTAGSANSDITDLYKGLESDLRRFVSIARESGVPDDAISAAMDEVEEEPQEPGENK